MKESDLVTWKQQLACVKKSPAALRGKEVLKRLGKLTYVCVAGSRDIYFNFDTFWG